MITEKLPIDIKEKWIQALQSGEYKQTTGTLCDKNGYCCLGVLAKVCNVPQDKIEGDMILPEDWTNYGIPKMVTGEAYNNKEIVGAITEMNDDEGAYDNEGNDIIVNQKSFTEIAEWIKINL